MLVKAPDYGHDSSRCRHGVLSAEVYQSVQLNLTRMGFSSDPAKTR